MARDHEQEWFDKLTGAKKHFCPCWDGMAIDENSPEFEACLCFEVDKVEASQ